MRNKQKEKKKNGEHRAFNVFSPSIFRVASRIRIMSTWNGIIHSREIVECESSGSRKEIDTRF